MSTERATENKKMLSRSAEDEHGTIHRQPTGTVG